MLDHKIDWHYMCKQTEMIRSPVFSHRTHKNIVGNRSLKCSHCCIKIFLGCWHMLHLIILLLLFCLDVLYCMNAKRNICHFICFFCHFFHHYWRTLLFPCSQCWHFLLSNTILIVLVIAEDWLHWSQG
jgi:hypothetical protein